MGEETWKERFARDTRTGKQKQDGFQADMEHSGQERALTEKVSDSVTVGKRALPLSYLCCSCSVIHAQ